MWANLNKVASHSDAYDHPAELIHIMTTMTIAHQRRTTRIRDCCLSRCPGLSPNFAPLNLTSVGTRLCMITEAFLQCSHSKSLWPCAPFVYWQKHSFPSEIFTLQSLHENICCYQSPADSPWHAFMCDVFEGVWSRGEWVGVWLNVCGCIFEGVCVCVREVEGTVRAGLEIWNHCDNGK